MTKLHSIVLIAAAAAFLAGCKKETVISGNPITATSFASLTDAYEKVEVQAQTFNVNGTLGSSFRGPHGSRFVFPANAFVTSTGQAVTGTVQVAVREILTPSDAIFSRILPTSVGQPLISGGAVWAFATQYGNTVLLRDGASYTVHMPQRFGAAAIPGLAYYQGIATDSSAGLSVVDFVAGVSGSVAWAADTVSLTTDTFAYVGANLPLGFLDTDTFSIALTGAALPTVAGTGNAAVYMMPRGMNTAIPITNFVGSRKDRIISGEVPTHIVAIAVVDGKFSGGVATVADTRSGDTYTVNLEATSPADLKAKIDALP